MTEWNRILCDEIYSPEEPDDLVIQFLQKLQKREKPRILDLGCGRGRHVSLIAQEGLEAHVADASDAGLELTKQKLSHSLDAHVVKCDMKRLPYVSSCFDAVVSLRTIYHQDLRGVQETISEINRVLSKSGAILVDFLSKRTYSFAKGLKVEKDTYMEDEGPEQGLLHHFADRKELEQLFGNFKYVSIEIKERTVEGKLRSRWIVRAKT
jgi:ubiquinone/menaquinone biosynthesis C-methylase UbiE